MMDKMIACKELLLKHNILNIIDIHFANHICALQDNDKGNEELWLLAATSSYYSAQGNSALNIDTIKDKKLLEIFNIENNNDIQELKDKTFPKIATNSLLKNYKVIGKPNELKYIIFDTKLFYLNKFYNYEVVVADFIKKRLKIENNNSRLNTEINKLFPENIIKETGEINYQKVSAIMALYLPFSIISGGPGTGKTTTVGKILSLYLTLNPNLNITLIAPTGKAVDRLNESIRIFKAKHTENIDNTILQKIPENAQTIHRFLGINSRISRYDKYHKSSTELLVIDESSMVSLTMFAKTFEALSDKCRVILLGDKDQLMSVEIGTVLKDLTNTETINSFSNEFVTLVNKITNNKIMLNKAKTPAPLENSVVQLEHSYRFKTNSGIDTLSKEINKKKQFSYSKEIRFYF